MNKLLQQVPHFVAAWKWSHGKRLAIIAAVASAGEVWVTGGGWLPFAEDTSPRLRLMFIAGVVGLAYILKWKANRESDRG